MYKEVVLKHEQVFVIERFSETFEILKINDVRNAPENGILY